MRQPTDSFSFGDSPALADELASLVLVGTKTATCWAAVGGLKTEVGKRWIVLSGDGRALAVIETIGLTQRRFNEVTQPSLTTREKMIAASLRGGKRTGGISLGLDSSPRT